MGRLKDDRPTIIPLHSNVNANLLRDAFTDDTGTLLRDTHGNVIRITPIHSLLIVEISTALQYLSYCPLGDLIDVYKPGHSNKKYATAKEKAEAYKHLEDNVQKEISRLNATLKPVHGNEKIIQYSRNLRAFYFVSRVVY